MNTPKFRAWDKTSKKWADDVEVYGDGTFNAFSGYERRVLCDLNNTVLIQYTGLKDKNGKEVCVGDIIKYHDSFNMWITTYVYHNGIAFAIKTPENPIFLEEFTSDYTYKGEPVPEIEIIGNIYETPELLEDK
jgi:uncharacterized phage protein (TIGR01671 family)